MASHLLPGIWLSGKRSKLHLQQPASSFLLFLLVPGSQVELVNMNCKKVEQRPSELEFNPCKKVVQQLGQEAVPCGSDFFVPARKLHVSTKLFTQ